MALRLRIDGASELELRRGIRAALAVFDRCRITPEQCAKAHWKLLDESEELTHDELDLAAIWREAEEAAIDGCCSRWRALPDNMVLELTN